MQKQADGMTQAKGSKKENGNESIPREVFEAALERTPTGGNSKPFSWYWNDNVLHIQHHAELAAHYLNRNMHTSWISLGCLITSVEIAAQSQGFETTTQVQDNLSVEFHFDKSSSLLKSDSDLKALFERRTYRGKLSPSSVPTLVSSIFTASIQTHIIANSQISKPFKKFLMKADSYLWLQKKATLDFFKEIVFSPTNGRYQRGIEVKDLGVGFVDKIMLRLFKKFPWLPSYLARIPGLNSSFRANTLRAIKNAHMVLITSKDLQPSSLVLAGKQAMRTWIDLEKQGYKVQPLSMASITLVDAATQALPGDTLPSFAELFNISGPEVMSEQFKLKADEKPVWLLRAGKI